jgi:hypothetical protein
MMFEIAIVFLPRVLLVLVGFWLYRKLRSRKGFQHTVIGRNGVVMRPTQHRQKGYVSLNKKPLKNVSKKGDKVPWGW